MTSTKTTSTTDQRAELAERLAVIERRINARAGEVSTIEGRQLEAATAGDEPDPAAATSKSVLVDAQGIDQRAAAAVRGQIDQLDAQLAREAALRQLGKLRRQAAATAAEAQVAADAYPGAQTAALGAFRAIAEGLRDHAARVQTLTERAVVEGQTAAELAQRLGEPAGHVAVPNHAEAIGRQYPVGTHLPQLRVFAATRRSLQDLLTELANAALAVPVDRSGSGPVVGLAAMSDVERTASIRSVLGLPTFLQERQTQEALLEHAERLARG